MTLTALISPATSTSIDEGALSSFRLVFTGYSGTVSYQYSFEPGTAGAADFSGSSSSGSFSVMSTSLYTEVIPIRFQAHFDMIDEVEETFYLNVQLSGATFANGLSSARIEILLRDDEASHGTVRADDWAGTRLRNIYFGHGGDDSIFGLAGNDDLYGGAGNDILAGGKGVDLIDGGEGDDILSGGSQADVFRFRGAFGHDRITDFAVRGDDVIDLSGWDGPMRFRQVARQNATQTNEGVLIELSGKGSILVEGIALAELSMRDFLF